VIPSAAGGASQTRKGVANTVDAIKQKMMVRNVFIMPPYSIIISTPLSPAIKISNIQYLRHGISHSGLRLCSQITSTVQFSVIAAVVWVYWLPL
jgi:hypothetical protein